MSSSAQLVLDRKDIQVESNGVIMRASEFHEGYVEIVADLALFVSLAPIEGRFKRYLSGGIDKNGKRVSYFAYASADVAEAQGLYDRCVAIKRAHNA